MSDDIKFLIFLSLLFITGFMFGNVVGNFQGQTKVYEDLKKTDCYEAKLNNTYISPSCYEYLK